MKLAKKEGIKRLILLDAHAILHRGYHALPDFSSSKGEPTGALYGVVSMFLGIINDLSPDYIIACFDLPKPTIRHELYDGYKGKRQKTDDGLIAQINRSHDVFKAFSIPEYSLEGFEADDILGTIVEILKNNHDVEIIIASGDMDTLQLTDDKKVRVYTLRKGIKDVVLYGEDEVLSRYGFLPLQIPDYKGLAGDQSDNIIGIKGIGEKTATILVKEFGTLEKMYEAMEAGKKKKFDDLKITPRVYKLLEDGKDEALFSKMLATIRRDAPISFSLPEKKWKETVDISVAKEILRELEFKSLVGRFEGILNEVKQETFSSELFSDKKVPVVDKEMLEKAGIGLWLLNSTITNATLDDCLSYAKTDSLQGAISVIERDIKQKGLDDVYRKIELPVSPVLKEMSKHGIKIDKSYLQKLGLNYRKELQKIEREIWKLAGKEFNVASPKQLGEILFSDLGLKPARVKKTPGGALSTKESELVKMAELHPIIGSVLQFRELSKLLSTYIDVIPTLLDKNNRLHTTYIQTGSMTGRMASENPNLQNIPIKSELGRNIRNAFIAEKGYQLVAFDYSQIELRIAAMLSGDRKLIEIFKNGEDVHAGVASKMFNVPMSEVNKQMRNRAKVINFGILYGMGVNALRENLKTTRDEARQFYDDYFKTFVEIASWVDKTKREAEKNGFTVTMYGRRRYFEGIHSNMPHIKASAERMAINAPIQGTQADIVKLAMVKIHEYIQKENLAEDVRMLLQIHDELIFEIKDKVSKKVFEDIRKIMQNIMSDKETLGVPVIANVCKGLSWGEMREVNS